jgi:hypothetical protein
MVLFLSFIRLGNTMKELTSMESSSVSAANMGFMGALTLCALTSGFEGVLICGGTGFALGSGWFFNNRISQVTCGNHTTLL